MFSKEVADSVLELLGEGKSLRKAAEECGTTAQSVLRWVESEPAFAEQYARTRARAYEMLADDIIDISDGPGLPMDGEDGNKAELSAVARDRLRVDSRKWMLAKMLPKKYGDKLELGGGLDINNKIERITRKIVDPSGTGPRDA